MKQLNFVQIMDNLMIEVFKITKEQLDILFELATEEEIQEMMQAISLDEENSKSTISKKRKALEIKHKYLNK